MGYGIKVKFDNNSKLWVLNFAEGNGATEILEFPNYEAAARAAVDMNLNEGSYVIAEVDDYAKKTLIEAANEQTKAVDIQE